MPTDEQELLLRASLATGREALRAWEEWSARVDLEALDRGATRLLPLLYRNLAANGVAHPWMGRLKGTYRRAWYQNQVALRDLARVLALLDRHGIPTLVLKGAALSLLHYRDPGARPMEDVDVAVHPRDAARAFAELARDGWRTWTREPERYLSVFHAHAFARPGATSLDLHWHALTHSPDPRANELLAAATVPIRVGDRDARTLDATGHLLHAIVHGLAWNPTPGIRWVADSVVIVRGGEVDWGRLVRLTRRLEAGMAVRAGIAYLRERHSVAVPASALDDLRRVRTSPLERALFLSRTRDRARRLGERLRYTVLEHAWRTRAFPLWRRIALFPRFIELRTESPSVARAARVLWRRARGGGRRGA